MQAPDTGQTAPPRRDDAGTFKITDRDITGLALCAEQYGAPYDLLATALEVTVDRLRGITARWRHAGYATTGSLGHGPAWCWPTPAGMRLLGLAYTAQEPSVTRLAHIRAVLATRLWLQAGQVYQDGQAWWRSERRIRAATGDHAGTAHLPDAEVHWPSLDASPYGGQIWAIEAELTPKPLDRTVAIMRALLARTSDYGPATSPSHKPRYGQVVYLTAPAATPTVTRAITELPAPLQARMVARDLPPGATRQLSAGPGALLLGGVDPRASNRPGRGGSTGLIAWFAVSARAGLVPPGAVKIMPPAGNFRLRDRPPPAFPPKPAGVEGCPARRRHPASNRADRPGRVKREDHALDPPRPAR